MVNGYAERLVEQQNGRLTPTQTRVLERGIQKEFRKEYFGDAEPKKKRKRTKEELEGIRTARKGRLITPTKSRSVGRAVTGILGALLPQEAMAGAVSYAKKGTKGTGKGRGRPTGTFKARYVPGHGTVRVPTHIYRKMMSEAKAKRRLAEAQAQAKMQQQYEAEQIAMQQDPRFQQQPDSFLESPDMIHEQRLQSMEQDRQIQREFQQQPRPSFMQRAGQTINKIGGGINQITQEMQRRQFEKQQRIAQRQMEQGTYPQRQQFGQQVGKQFGRPRTSQIKILSEKSSILNVPNIFNNPPRRH